MSLFDEYLLRQVLFRHIVFDSKRMIEETFHEIIRNEKYEWENELSKARAHCPFRYCPSSIQIRSIRMNGGEYYYLSSLPHFHKPSLYQGNPQDLPSFLQLVLYYNSGIEYFNQLLRLL